MSDLMLTAVLSMPYDMAMGDEFSRRQFWDRAQQALAEIERLQVGIELIETENADLLTRLDLESGTVGMIARECADLRRQLDGCSQMLARQAAEIERLTAAGVGYSQQTVDALSSERDRLRAALIAAMEIVMRERVRIAYNAKGAPPAIEIGYADILRRLDAVIAQADAALGSER